MTMYLIGSANFLPTDENSSNDAGTFVEGMEQAQLVAAEQSRWRDVIVYKVVEVARYKAPK